MAGLIGAVDRRGGVASWWTFPWPAVPFVNGQIETSPRDGKQYRYDATANEWYPVPEPSADRGVAIGPPKKNSPVTVLLARR